MKINVFGLGYVGCVSAACLAAKGHHVTGIDIDAKKVSIINRGKSPIVEMDLERLIKESIKNKKLHASADDIPMADLSLVCVGTPSNENGSLNLDYLLRVCEEIGQYIRETKSYHVVSFRSTMLPGTIEEFLIPILTSRSGKKLGKDFSVCMNPEFMREGTSVHDFNHPPFTIIGEYDKKGGDVLERVYSDLKEPVIRTSIKVAEMIKYSCNCFHALKIGFANEIGNICKKMAIDSHQVMDIFCKDTKLNLSKYYLRPGFAFGGSCLPKDLRAITYLAKQKDLDLPILSSIMENNRKQIEHALNYIARSKHRKIGILGLSFKPGTDDLRESPMVELVEKLIGKGYQILIHDKEVSLAKIFGSNKNYIDKMIPHISSLLVTDLKQVIQFSGLIVIGKSSEEYKDIIRRNYKKKDIYDLDRSIYLDEKTRGKYDGICW